MDDKHKQILNVWKQIYKGTYKAEFDAFESREGDFTDIIYSSIAGDYNSFPNEANLSFTNSIENCELIIKFCQWVKAQNKKK